MDGEVGSTAALWESVGFHVTVICPPIDPGAPLTMPVGGQAVSTLQVVVSAADARPGPRASTTAVTAGAHIRRTAAALRNPRRLTRSPILKRPIPER
jgi:hypothetical protein